MAGKKVGLVLKVDGEKEYIQALSNATKETRLHEQELKSVKQAFSDTANSMDALRATQETLTRAQESYRKKVDAANSGLENAVREYNKHSDRLQELRKRLQEAETAQEQIRKSSGESSDDFKEQTKRVDELSAAVRKQTENLSTAQGRVTDWNKRLVTAEAGLRKVNKEIDQNEKYLDEASRSTDGCATSIDRYGNAVEEAAHSTDELGESIKDATEVTTTFGDKVGQAIVSKGVSVGTDLLASGVEALKDAMIDGSKAAAQLTASTGLSEAAAKRYQKVMQQIRAKNYGEDYQDIADVMSQTIQIMGELGDEDMSETVKSAISLRDTFDMDVNESLRAADAMVTTMGVDAQAAFDLIVAGAQNGLNRSGELVDNITEYAQLWGQAGFSAREMFAILDNGLNSGAYSLDKVNDYVKEFGNSLADGRIEENLDYFSDGTEKLFRKWKDGEATTRDVFYSVIKDLSDAENQQEALTVASEVWSSLGEDNAMQVITALDDLNTKYDDVKGSMEELQEVRYSDLESAIGRVGSAIQDKIISPVTDAAAPALAGILNSVADVISGGSEVAESSVHSLVRAAEEANAQISASTQNTQAAMANAGAEADEIGVLGERLIKLNSIEDKTLAQKDEMSVIVGRLSSSIPALASAYDFETGSLNKTNAELQSMIANTQQLILQQAAQAAQQELLTQAIEAQQALDNANEVEASIIDRIGLLNEEKQLMEDLYGDKGMDPEVYDARMLEFWKQRLDDCTISQEEYNRIVENGAYVYDNYFSRLSDVENALAAAREEVTDASAASKEAQDNLNAVNQEMEDLDESVDKLAERYSEQTDAMNEATDATGESGESAKKTAEVVASAAKAIGSAMVDAKEHSDEYAEAVWEAFERSREAAEDGAEAQKNAMDSIRSAYESTVQSIESDLQNKIDLTSKFDGGEDLTTEEINANLQSQIEGLTNYRENLEKVRAMTDESGMAIFSPEVMNLIESQGLDMANILDHIVYTWEEQGEYGAEQVRGIADKWAESLDMTEDMAKTGAANQLALQSVMKELGSSDFDFSKLSEAIESAEIPETARLQLQEAVAIAREVGIQIPDGLAEGIQSGQITPESALAQLNGSVEGSLEGLVSVAKEQGISIPAEISAGISSGGTAAVEAYNALIGLLNDQAAAAREAGEAVGAETASGTQSSIESGTEGVKTASASMASEGASAASGKKSEFQTAGSAAAAKYASGISSNKSNARTQASLMASQAVSAANAYQGSFYSAGFNAASGLASGISAGRSRAIAAARSMAANALAAAKAELEIHSPSKKFRDQVGAQISRGTAFGISDKASLAGKAAAKMSNTVYSKAVSWLSKYKNRQKVSLADEQWYWAQVLKHTKKGTAAYTKVLQNYTTAKIAGGIGSTSLASKVAKNFGVSRTETTGSGKSKKTTTKDAATYYSEIYSEAERYLNNYQAIHKMSLAQEKAYWQAVQKQLQTGTQAWFDAQRQINSLNAEISEAQQAAVEEAKEKAKEVLQTRAKVQDDILDKYKVYYKVSAKAEMDYWNIARKQFKLGTDERIEADQKYYEAAQEVFDQRKDLDEEYAVNSQKINDDLIDSIKELQDAYKDAVASRKEDILSQMNLFESWDATGYDADTLLYNLKTQVAGLALWEQQLEELSQKKISAGLLEELKEMGPEAAANIYSLNQMTAEQLEEYSRLWDQKNSLAESQALKDNAELLQETNNQIGQLRQEAQDELDVLNTEYRAALQELYAGISTDLQALVKKAGSIGEDAVSSLILAAGKTVNSVESYKSTTAIVNTISDQLTELEQQGSIIGKNTLDGILDGLTDQDKIISASQNVVQSIKRAIESEAQIHSPARLFRMDGIEIAEGVAGGLEDGTRSAADAAKKMIRELSDVTKNQIQSLSEQEKGLNYSGISQINRIMESYSGRQNVTVNNTGLAEAMLQLFDRVDGLAEAISGMQFVFDTGQMAGALQQGISRETARSTVRARGGRL